jgi:DNA-binding winged helix-turn-helix (wHTH) protein/TolB-like protein/Tfp pilus assembly protein PilF
VINNLPLVLYEFGPFRLCLNDRLLYSGDRLVPLTPKLIETLVVLVENNGRVVTKDALMASLWPDSFVEESSLTQNISLLRKALAETDPGQYIETIPKRGYRFVADVRQVSLGNGNGATILHEHTSAELVIEEQIIDDTRESNVPATSAMAHHLEKTGRSTRPVYAVLVLCFIGVSASAFYLLNRGHSSRQVSVPKSVAVLPFKAIDAQPDGDVIGLGMANAVILGLSSLKNVTVLPTSSVFQYTKRDKDARLIGRELGVDAVLDGTVQRVNHQVRVTALLIRSSDGRSLWSGQFDAIDTDTFAIQESISKELTAALAPNIEHTGKPTVRVPSNFAAYDSYSFGLYFMSKRGRENLTRAVSYLEQSIKEDSDFALAHALLAGCYFDIGITEREAAARAKALDQARAEATRALQLDPSLAEAYSVMGMLSLDSGDFVTGESKLRRAIELDPNSAVAHSEYGTFLYTQARFSEANNEIRQAQELAPLSPSIHESRAVVLLNFRDYDGVIDSCKKALELQPDRLYPRSMLAQAYALKGMFAEAFAEVERFAGSDAWLADWTRIYVTALAGRIEEAKRDLRVLEHSETRLRPYEFAVLYATVGEKDKALAAVEKSVANVGKFESKQFLRELLKQDPRLDCLRSDLQFMEYVARLER